MAGGIWLAALAQTDVLPPPAHLVRLRAEPGSPGSVPAGMMRLPALELDLGSTDSEIAEAFAWCRTLMTAGDCRKDLYERERPVHHVYLSALLLDIHERSTGELATWLSGLSDLREEGGWLVAGGVRLAEVGRDRDLRLRGTVVVPRPGSERLPAVDVTYNGARRFCQARRMDLPTEAQWERAARGAERRMFPWGDQPPMCDHAVYGRGPSGPCPRGERAPVDMETRDRTPEGIANLGANVAEWVIDRYGTRYPGCAVPCTDPVMAPTSDPQELHVIRGGAFESAAEQLRGAGRARAPRDAAFGNTGFRCARSITPETQ